MRILIFILFILGCVLTGIMTGWNIQLIKAFTWSPERTASSTWFLDLSFFLCAVLFFVPPILVFFKSRLAGITAFILTLILSIWQLGLIQSIAFMFVYGTIDLTNLFYLFCLLMYFFVLIVSGIMTFGGLKDKID
ncbi:hypothetical protein [Fluviicola taffensis]|uniref:hypothetical protein n=1 Tax=Fluviicola taffensis TaxID=191579 RepID=UPI003137F06C